MSFAQFRRYALTLLSLTAALGLATGQALGQGSSGKLQGRVLDAGGQPVVAAQVYVEGTNRGNITNAQGDYFINEVPAGLHRVTAQRIGYRTFTWNDQRVLAGQTLTVNFTLEQAAVEVQALVVQSERNTPVPRDQVSSKSIVTGETIDQLPLDNSSSIVLLQPGVIATNAGRTIRGSRPGEEAVYVDGVLVRRYQSGLTTGFSAGQTSVAAVEPLELPTNSLAQVDVTTGGFGARFGEAQSGVINYVTRSGGSRFQGAASLMTDRIAPVDWSSGLTRGELSFGGPLYRNLSFFLAGVAEARAHGDPSEGRLQYVPVGVDTTFRLEAAGGDSVDVVFPEFQLLERGGGNPFQQSDEVTAVAKLSMGIGSGNKLDLSYYKNRNQSVSSGSFNTQSRAAGVNYSDVLTAGSYFVLAQSAERALALDLKVSLQRDRDVSGTPDPTWFNDNQSTFLGFRFSSPDFLLDPADFEVDETLVKAYRSRLLAAESLQIFQRRTDLSGRQAVPGVNSTLRLNPYGIRSGFDIGGYSNDGISWGEEKRLVLNGALDWQANRYNRIQIGGDYTKIDIEGWSLNLYTGGPNAPFLREPIRSGAFITNRLDLGDVVIDGGLRFDYFDSKEEYSIVPGFVVNIPDSLRAGLFTTSPDPTGTVNWRDRLIPLVDCGGAATAASRRRRDGTLVCNSNFVEAETKTAWSPRLAVSFPVTVSSTFRLSYGHNVQVPNLAQVFSNSSQDFSAGLNTNSLFGRDVNLPKTVMFEAGYRQMFGSGLVVDAAVYSKTVRNGLTYRILGYDNPKIPGQTININSLTNADYTLARGIDLKFDKRLAQTTNVMLSYSYVDAKGTGSNPLTYLRVISRGTTNASLLNNGLVDPPEIMLPLDQSRTHNFASTVVMNLPSDWGSGVANSVLGDVGVFATARAASGLRFTRFQNQGAGITGPPPGGSLASAPVEPINASQTPWTKTLDLKVQKGLNVAGKRIRAFADLRNPFNIANTGTVYLETGSIENEFYFQTWASQFFNDALLDNNNLPGTFTIASSPENALNRYALMQAEKRFGNGDGIYTLEEQEKMARQYFQQTRTLNVFRSSGQSVRLGFEIVF